jgi:hypothetical protein
LRVTIVDTSSALVEVCARCAAAGVSRVARARERPRDVGARCDRVAVVCASVALVHIPAANTADTRPDVALVARARERPCRVGARGSRVARVGASSALVNVGARNAVTRETRGADALKRPNDVPARRFK